jgi:predicted alpha/beta superfamily hydrolase
MIIGNVQIKDQKFTPVLVSQEKSTRDFLELNKQSFDHEIEKSEQLRQMAKKTGIGKPVSGGTYTGNIRVHKKFHSEILGNDRDIHVYLPPGYSQDKHYPALYVSDGQSAFNKETSHNGQELCLDETAEKLIKEGKIKDVIIVAIDNIPDKRINEYTPFPDPKFGGGNLDKYNDFLTKELKPFIDANYSTSLKSEDTGIMGSSLGGLNAVYTGFKFPDIFNIVGAISPSAWWAEKEIVKWIEEDINGKGPSKIWIDVGTNESSKLNKNYNGDYDMIEGTRALNIGLLKKGYEEGKDLTYI